MYELKTETFHGTPMTSAYAPDGGYIGTEEFAKNMEARGIQPELREPTNNVCSIGFCDKEQKWYGWSHRAIYGFGIGSKVAKGDCAYVGATPEDLIEDRVNFFGDISKEKADITRAECQILADRIGIRVLHAPLIIPMVESLDEAFEPDGPTPTLVDLHKDAVSIIKCGRGEWEAATLDDAKQMAKDFAESVS